MVNRPYGAKSSQLLERHDASDFELRTQDKLDRIRRQRVNYEQVDLMKDDK